MGPKIKTGTLKQARELISKQEQEKVDLSAVIDITDDRKSLMNTKIIKLIHSEVESALDGKWKELAELESQKFNKKSYRSGRKIFTQILKIFLPSKIWNLC